MNNKVLLIQCIVIGIFNVPSKLNFVRELKYITEEFNSVQFLVINVSIKDVYT